MNSNTTTARPSTNKQPQLNHLHRSATQIQSQWRGHSTRKQITDWARKEFENIVMEIEGKDSEISWNLSKLHSLPMPSVTNTKLSEDENDLDRILSNLVNRNETSSGSNEKYHQPLFEKPSNQSSFMEQREIQQQKNAQKLFEEKLKEVFAEPSIQKPEQPQTSNSSMNTSAIIQKPIPKITREQEIQTETLRASMTQSMIKENQQAATLQNRRLVTVSTNTSIALDGIPKIQEQKTHGVSIEIPLEEVSSVHSQEEDLSDMLNESAIMMSNLDMLKSFDFSEMKKSSESNISNQAPTKSKEPIMPQQPIQTKQKVSNDVSRSTSKQSRETPLSNNNSTLSNSNNINKQSNSSIKSNMTASVNHTPSPSSSQISENLQQQKQQAKQELQQQMSMLRYEIQLAEEAYSRRKKELVEERKRQIR